MTLKKILFIAYFYPPVAGVGTPGAQRILKFQRYLDLESSSVLTIKPDCYPDYMNIHDDAENIMNIQDKTFRTNTIDFLNMILGIRNILMKNKSISDTSEPSTGEVPKGITSNKVSSFQIFKDSVSFLITFPDFASPWLITGIVKGTRVILKEKTDIIFATGMPWTSLIIGFFLKLITQRKLIIDFRDPWVDNPFIKKNKFEKMLEKFTEGLIVKTADLITVNTTSLKEQMQKRYPDTENKIILLPNGYDEFDFIKIKPKNEIDDKLIIVHAGFLYGNRDPKPILDAISLLYDLNPKIAEKIIFQQVGEIDLDYDIREFCKEKGLIDNLILSGQVEYSQCLSILAGSDILLLLQQGTMSQIPSKFYEYLFLEKHILAIAETGSDLANVIMEDDLGHVYTENSIKELSHYFLKLFKKKTENDLTVKYLNKDRHNIKNITAILQKSIDCL